MNQLRLFCLLSRFMLFSDCQYSEDKVSRPAKAIEAFTDSIITSFTPTTFTATSSLDTISGFTSLPSASLKDSKVKKTKKLNKTPKLLERIIEASEKIDADIESIESAEVVQSRDCFCGDIVGYICSPETGSDQPPTGSDQLVTGSGRPPTGSDPPFTESEPPTGSEPLTGSGCVADAIYRCGAAGEAAEFVQRCPTGSQCVRGGDGHDHCVARWFEQFKMRVSIKF